MILQALGNVMTAKVSNSSPKEADKVGRGTTIANLLVDEAAFVNNIERALSAWSMAGNAARTFAREKGLPWGTLLFTTAGELSSRDGAYIYKMLGNSTPFNEILFECKDHEELIRIVRKNSSTLNSKDAAIRVNLSMTYRQMGFSEEWMQQKLDEGNSSDANIERDLFNKWQTGTSQSPIDANTLEVIHESEVHDPRVEIYDPYAFILNWYVSGDILHEKIQQDHHFIIGVDTSDGIGRDDISFYIRDIVTGELICGALFNELNLITLSEFFADFLVRYPNSTMVIERRSSAPTIIDNIILKLSQAGINPYKRIFNTIVQNKEKYEKEYRELMNARPHDIDLFNKYKSHLGFKTSGDGETSRKQLYGTVMLTMLKYTAHTTRDGALVRQLLGIVVKNNRIDHVDGGKDDAVIANLLIWWLMLNGKNLSSYGIISTTILKENDVYLDEKFEVDGDAYAREESIQIEREIAALVQEIKVEEDMVIVSQLERKIRYLYSNVSSNSNHISADEIIENAKKERLMKRRLAT